MNDQIRALIWLRAILFARSVTGEKVLSIVWAVCIVSVVGLVALAFAAMLFAMATSFGTSPENVLGITDIFIIVLCVIWLFSLLNELQRSEIIDFRKMLYLPVSLEMVFVMNYLVALLSPILILFIIPLLGYTLGLTISRGPRMLLCLPLGVAFYLALSAWLYYVRGILSALLANPKRRRLVLSILPILVVALSQIPSFLNIAYHQADPQSGSGQAVPQFANSHIAEKLAVPVNLVLPPGWFAFGAASLAARYYGYAALSFGGLVLLCGGGLALGYRNTRRFYTMAGASGRQAVPSAETKAARRERPLRRLAFLPGDVSALVSVFSRTLLRNPQTYGVMLMSVVVSIFPLAVLVFRKDSGPVLTFLPLLASIWPCFTMMGIIQCGLGWDLGGYRSMILLPGSRGSYLLAANLAAFPITLCICLAMLVLSLFLGLSLTLTAVSLILFVQCYLALCMAGNFLGVYFPVLTTWQGMRRKNKFQLGPFLLMFLTPVIYGPAAVCAFSGRLLGTTDRLPLLCAAILTALTIVVYRAALKGTGKVLQRRELIILQKFIRDRE